VTYCNKNCFYSSLQLNEVQNQGFTNQIILLPSASKPMNLYLMQKKIAVYELVIILLKKIQYLLKVKLPDTAKLHKMGRQDDQPTRAMFN
jgi:hypothetical protein